MRDIKPKYSRTEVDKAGALLMTIPTTFGERRKRINAFGVLNNWRSSHNYPINTFQANLRKKIKDGGFKQSIVAQRLKRTPSILSKLERNPSMKLSRMQDIGGLRAVVATVKQVYDLREAFIQSKFSHVLAREYDYIKEPKLSGYRSIHLVYKYMNSRAPEYDKLLIEVQLRNKLQHSWATAVETMGTFLNTSLKSSEGPEQWLDFFAMAGSSFAYYENSPPHEKYSTYNETTLAREIKTINEEMRVTERLHAFGTTIKAIDSRGYHFKYYLLHLKPLEHTVRMYGYHATQLDAATEKYVEMEKDLGAQRDEQVVLVSGSSFQQLKLAYPNFFLDTSNFITYLNRIIKKFG